MITIRQKPAKPPRKYDYVTVNVSRATHAKLRKLMMASGYTSGELIAKLLDQVAIRKNGHKK